MQHFSIIQLLWLCFSKEELSTANITFVLNFRSRLSATQSIPEIGSLERSESIVVESDQPKQETSKIVTEKATEEDSSLKKMGRQVEFVAVESLVRDNSD